jgi:hypothetical protein
VSAAYTPAASGLTAPAHYLASDSTHNSYISPTPSANYASGGILDVAIWVSAASYTVANTLASRWPTSGSTFNASNSSFLFSLTNAGVPSLAWVDTAGAFHSQAATTGLSALAATTPDSTLGVWLRFQLNVSGAAWTTPAGSAVASIPSGALVMSAAVPTSSTADSNAWTQVGTTVTGLGTAGIAASTANTAVGTLNSGNAFAGKVYKALMRTASGNTVIANPDFTAQTTGITSFADTAPTPNTWTVAAGGEI